VYQETGAQLDNEVLCEHVTELMVTGREIKVHILRKQQVKTDRTIPNII
jgi:hypothetical protein